MTDEIDIDDLDLNNIDIDTILTNKKKQTNIGFDEIDDQDMMDCIQDHTDLFFQSSRKDYPINDP